MLVNRDMKACRREVAGASRFPGRSIASRSWLALVAVMAATAACSDSADRMRKQAPDFSFTLDVLMQEVIDNKLALGKLEDKYRGKVVELSEAALRYDPRLNADKKTMTIFIGPSFGGSYYYATCDVAEDAIPDFGKVHEGSRLSLKGRFKELSTKHEPYGVPTLTACVLTK